MSDTPVFQGHHVIEQDAYKQSRLLRELSKQDLFDLHAPRNLLNLPVDRALAAQLDLSPHPGGPLGAYSEGVQLRLERLQQSPDGQAALRGDRAAAERMAVRVGELTDTMKAGLVNGDLH
jgi:A nuclease family of the HNH/ENDO VII superfamily with conserved AHH